VRGHDRRRELPGRRHGRQHHQGEEAHEHAAVHRRGAGAADAAAAAVAGGGAGVLPRGRVRRGHPDRRPHPQGRAGRQGTRAHPRPHQAHRLTPRRAGRSPQGSAQSGSGARRASSAQGKSAHAKGRARGREDRGPAPFTFGSVQLDGPGHVGGQAELVAVAEGSLHAAGEPFTVDEGAVGGALVADPGRPGRVEPNGGVAPRHVVVLRERGRHRGLARVPAQHQVLPDGDLQLARGELHAQGGRALPRQGAQARLALRGAGVGQDRLAVRAHERRAAGVGAGALALVLVGRQQRRLAPVRGRHRRLAAAVLRGRRAEPVVRGTGGGLLGHPVLVLRGVLVLGRVLVLLGLVLRFARLLVLVLRRRVLLVLRRELRLLLRRPPLVLLGLLRLLLGKTPRVPAGGLLRHGRLAAAVLRLPPVLLTGRLAVLRLRGG